MDDKINATKKISEKGSVLSSTLSEMNEFDMNKLNDQGRATKKG